MDFVPSKATCLLEERTQPEKDYALRVYSNLGYLDSVISLLKVKADPNAANSDGETALILATRKDNTQIVIELIKADANLNAQDRTGYTAIMYAELYNYIDTFTVLLEAKQKKFLETNVINNNNINNVEKGRESVYLPSLAAQTQINTPQKATEEIKKNKKIFGLSI